MVGIQTIVGLVFAALVVGLGVFLQSLLPPPPTLEKADVYDPEAVAKAAAYKGEHLWRTGRGNVGAHGVSKHVAPFDVNKSLAWNWSHPNHRYYTLTFGVAIDAESNIYLTGADAIRKFSPDGEPLWMHDTMPGLAADTAALMGGAIYSLDHNGHAFALSIDTGKLLWRRKVCPKISQDNGFVTAHEGVVIVGTDAREDSGEQTQLVRGLNASDGATLWTFKPDAPVWNFMGTFVGDGTFVFQDLEGRAYRCAVPTGQLLWKVGGLPGTWTDGTLTLGPNNIVYAVATFDHVSLPQKSPLAPGKLWAYALQDGRELWSVTTRLVPNVAPGVGKLYGKDKYSVVQACGQQVHQYAPTEIYAYDAESGQLQWTFEGPPQMGRLQAGDEEAAALRSVTVGRSLCLPNPWGAPVIDASGTVFIGNQEGQFYALRDTNGDGKVIGDDEVSVYHTGTCFAGSAGPAIAPGMIAACSCDTLFVFKTPNATTS